MTYDFIVVGGGIAGLAIAELLQRSGQSVLLLEASSSLCGMSSSDHQGWFHTGALYAAIPTPFFFHGLIKNLDNLFAYYSHFPRMNLRHGSSLITSDYPGWFGKEPINYFYEPSSRISPIFLRPLWYLAVLLAQGRLAWFNSLDFSKEFSSQISWACFSPHFDRCRNTKKYENIAFDSTSVILTSSDRTMNGVTIAEDLLKSFLCMGVS
ncbi:MAG: FAD-dependent oxidoreductase [Magnetococcales bacterium]|nr:FAD-dependent oxidoreductase [Magnetococcales bacterium]